MSDDKQDNTETEDKQVEIFSTDDEKVKLFGEMLSNDSSRKILQSLFNEELTANQISQKTGISLQLVKYHINKMQELDMIKVSKIEKNSKAQDMKFYTPSKFAVVILPSSRASEKAKESKSLKRSFKTLYKFAGVGVAAAAGLFSLSLFQEGEKTAMKYPRPELDTSLRVDEFTSGEGMDESTTGTAVTGSQPKPEVPVTAELEPVPEPEPAPEPEPEPEPEPSHGGIEQWSSSDYRDTSTLEEALELERRRIESGNSQSSDGGIAIFDAGDALLTVIIVGIIAGSIAGYFFWKARKFKK